MHKETNNNIINSFIFNPDEAELVHTVTKDNVIYKRYIGYSGGKYSGMILIQSDLYSISGFIPVERNEWYILIADSFDYANQLIFQCNYPRMEQTTKDYHSIIYENSL